MQGRPGPDNPRSWDERQTEARLAALRATHKHRTVSQRPLQRPPHMARLNTPPETPRVPRPQRETMPSAKVRRRTLILIACFAIAAIFACVVGTLLASGILQSSGPAQVTAHFFGALSSQDYRQAYQDLGPSITLPQQPSEETFTQQGTTLDQKYGRIIDYKEDAGSARNDNGKQSYTFTIKREKLEKTYKIRVTLQEVPNDGWKIIDYNNGVGRNLGPNQ